MQINFPDHFHLVFILYLTKTLVEATSKPIEVGDMNTFSINVFTPRASIAVV